MGAENYTPLENARAIYFTERSGVTRRLDLVQPPAVPSGEQLLEIVEHARDLSKAAARLRHLLPERADEALEETISMVRGQRGRYVIVWPDGELHGGWQGFYVQRPAMLRRWRAVTAHDSVLRVYDIKLGEFILGA